MVTLAQKVGILVKAIDDRDTRIAELEAERDRLASENEVAKQVIEKMAAAPLRPKTAGVVVDFTKRLPDFLAPEVRDFLQKTAGDTK